MIHCNVHTFGSGSAQVDGQADPHFWNSAFGPQLGTTKAVESPKATKLNSNAIATRGYIADALGQLLTELRYA